MSLVRSAVFAVALVIAPSLAAAQAPEVAQVAEEGAFDKDWALAVYGTGWAGDYGAGGIGGRLRWEPLDILGIELLTEATIVDWPGAFRHDHIVGFNLYVPLSIASWFRVRALAGLCATFSMVEPEDKHAPRGDDVQFGAHAGAGLEFALGDVFSLFVDALWNGYLGHARDTGGWTAEVSDELEWSHHVQVNAGLQIHL